MAQSEGGEGDLHPVLSAGFFLFLHGIGKRPVQKLYLPDNHENVDVITLSAAAGKAFVAATAKYEIQASG